MSKKIDLPKKLFVYKEWDGDTSYFMCYETERECADLEEDRLVGVYELKEIGVIKVKVVRKSVNQTAIADVGDVGDVNMPFGGHLDQVFKE